MPRMQDCEHDLYVAKEKPWNTGRDELDNRYETVVWHCQGCEYMKVEKREKQRSLEDY